MLKLSFHEKPDRSTFVEVHDLYERKSIVVGMHKGVSPGQAFFLPAFTDSIAEDALQLAVQSSTAKNKFTLYTPEAIVDTLWDDCLQKKLLGVGEWERQCLDSFFNVISITEGTGMFYVGGLEVSLYRPLLTKPAFSMFIRNPGSINLLVNLQAGLQMSNLIELVDKSGSGIIVLDPSGYSATRLCSLPETYRRSTIMIGIADDELIERYRDVGFIVPNGKTEVVI